MVGSGLWRSGGRLILLPLLATVAVCGLALAILSAAFAANAAAAPSAGSPPSSVPTTVAPVTGGPTFEVATASSDKPVVVPDFVKADDASTSFGDMFVQSLRTSPRVTDFASLEHEYSPKVAEHRVESGDAVLAVIVGNDFSSTFRRNMFSALRGGAVRPLPITVIAGPQALADKKLVLREYRKQAIKPTLDYLSDEMRIVVKKSGCDVPGAPHGRCITVTDSMLDKFASPFHTAVRRVNGPAATSYDYPSAHAPGSRASPAAPESAAPPAPTAHAAPVMNEMSMLMVLVVVSGLVAATTAAWAVDFRLGRAVFTAGPWRRQNTAMPFPRRKALLVQNAAGVVVGVVASSLLIAVYLARSGRLTLASASGQLDNVLLWAFAALVTVAIVLFVHALQAVIGTPGWLVAAVAVIGLGLPAAGIGSLLSGKFGAGGALLQAAGGMAHGSGVMVAGVLPAVVVMAVVAVASYAVGLAVSAAYDKFVTTAVVTPK